MRVAIIGSRDFPDLDLVRQFVDELPEDVIVISGGARGVDRTAEERARERGLKTTVFTADWNKFGKKAGLMRNEKIALWADRCIAFWDGESRGTSYTIELFKKLGKPVETIIKNHETPKQG